MEVCPLSRGVMSPDGSTPISSITEKPSLSPRSCTHTSIGSPCGSLSLSGKIWAYHVSSQCQSGLGPSLSAGSLSVHDRRALNSCTGSIPVWASLSAPLACSASRRLSGFRICCPYHSILAPNRFGASRSIVFSRFRYQPFGCGFIVPGASHRRVTVTACPGRILLVKQQVSLQLALPRQTLGRPHVAQAHIW